MILFGSGSAFCATRDNTDTLRRVSEVVGFKPCTIGGDRKQVLFESYYYNTYSRSTYVETSFIEKKTYDDLLKTLSIPYTCYIVEPPGDIIITSIMSFGLIVGVIIGPYPVTESYNDYVCIPVVTPANYDVFKYLIRDRNYVIDAFNGGWISQQLEGDTLNRILLCSLLFNYAAYEYEGYYQYFDYLPYMYFSGDITPIAESASDNNVKRRLESVSKLLPSYKYSVKSFASNKYVYVYDGLNGSLCLWYLDDANVRCILIDERLKPVDTQDEESQ